jgi:hypothetical protein
VAEQTNGLRKRSSLDPVRWNRELAAAARDFARYMARTDRYGHEADGREPIERARAHGYAPCLIAENIAFEYSSAGFATAQLARRFYQGWLNSPGHRRNMLDADATQTGVAIARSPRSGRYYAVQVFARPREQRTQFAIENRSRRAIGYRIGKREYSLAPRVVRTHSECRVESVQVRLPGRVGPAVLEPVDGRRYVVERIGGRFQMTLG